MKALLLFTLLLPFVANATTYYVDCNNGSDSNAGTSHAAAWKTVGKVNSTVTGTSDDVYFLAGCSWTGQLVVDWDGTSGDAAVIGSYYFSGSEQIGVQDGTEKPIISGNYSQAGDPINAANAIPKGQYNGLVEVLANYVTVQDIQVRYSAGRGILLKSTTSTPYNNMIVDNVDVHYTALNSLTFSRGSSYNILRNSNLGYCGQGAWNGDITSISSCIVAVNAHHIIFENNYAHNGHGEGMNCYNGSYSCIYRNNVLVGFRNEPLYVDNGYDVIMEGNMVINPSDSRYPGRAAAVAIAVEDYQNFTDTTGILIRNNLFFNSSSTNSVTNCFRIGMEPGAKAANAQISAKIFNNTCVGAPRGVLMNIGSAYTGSIEIANNIFEANDGSCAVVDNTDVTFDYNHWETVNSDPDCIGANDVTGSATLNRTDWSGVSMANLPTLDDFDLDTGSSAINAGQAQTAIEYTTEFDNSSNLQTGCTLDLTEATKDFFDLDRSVGCKKRSDPPEMGAFEVGTQTAPSPAVSLPFHMNIGSGAVGPLASGKSFAAEQYRNADGSILSFAGTSSAEVVNTDDDLLYQSWRAKNGSLTWSIPIANGNYDLTLLYQEYYWGVTEGTCTTAGSSRQFDVSVEGVLVQDEFDICKLAGAPFTAVRDVIPNISVIDGQLNIELSLGQGADPKPQLMGLEITLAAPIPAPPANLIVR